jgi:hypothetical protein
LKVVNDVEVDEEYKVKVGEIESSACGEAVAFGG